MLHCFDAVNLNELWAFIPNNLLYKLKNMRVKDPECGEFLFHHYFIDGSPVIRDVYLGSAWHTVLVCGQGMGWGRDHGFYYFALDVTDPMAPIPLWELTDPTMGETWSVPLVGKVDISGTPTWIAFMGSGYDTWDPTERAGNYFYAVDIATGQILKSLEISEHSEPASPFGIVNTVPGSPNGADNDRDGNIEDVYFGDLHGRFWKIDLTTGVNQWKAEVLYRDPYYHPIVTKPAVYVDLTTMVVTLYFGTGGDEKAPGTEYYSFVALKDGGATGVVQWYLGPADLAVQLGIDSSLKKGDFNQGEKIWADDVIADRLVYIATLTGNIENLNPCMTLSGSGRIYSRYISGGQTGGSALIGASGTAIESMVTAQKVRSAVTVGKLEQLTQEGSPTINKRLVFIQSYTQVGGARPEPPSEVLAQPVPIYSRLSIKSWREVYKIIR
jgi:Tfp pilus tip-associated adhesin PilY1